MCVLWCLVPLEPSSFVTRGGMRPRRLFTQLQQVLASVASPGHRRSGIQGPSVEHGQMVGKEVFYENTGRTLPNEELNTWGKCTKEFVLRQFWRSFVDDRLDLDDSIQTKPNFPTPSQ